MALKLLFGAFVLADFLLVAVVPWVAIYQGWSVHYILAGLLTVITVSAGASATASAILAERSKET